MVIPRPDQIVFDDRFDPAWSSKWPKYIMVIYC